MNAERELSTTFLSLIAQDKVHPILFLYADFPTVTYSFWTGLGNWNDGVITWTGMGGLVGIGGITENRDGTSNGLSVLINGIDEDTMAEISGQDYQGRLAYVNFGLMNPSTGVPEVLLGNLWEGELDSDDIQFGKDMIQLTLNCEHSQVETLRKREYHYNHSDQLFLFPAIDDTFFSRIEQIQSLTIPWGRKDK